MCILPPFLFPAEETWMTQTLQQCSPYIRTCWTSHSSRLLVYVVLSTVSFYLHFCLPSLTATISSWLVRVKRPEHFFLINKISLNNQNPCITYIIWSCYKWVKFIEPKLLLPFGKADSSMRNVSCYALLQKMYTPYPGIRLQNSCMHLCFHSDGRLERQHTQEVLHIALTACSKSFRGWEGLTQVLYHHFTSTVTLNGVQIMRGKGTTKGEDSVI